MLINKIRNNFKNDIMSDVHDAMLKKQLCHMTVGNNSYFANT